MDLVGKLTPTKEGYQYICVTVDYFTKWCEAFPLKTKSAEEINESVEEMIAEECVSEGIKRQDRLYQIVQDNMAQVQKKIRKRKLDQGEAVVMQVDGKSIDIVDDNSKLFPRINRDHLVHFLEDRPPKAPKVTSPITTTSSPATNFSVPNTTLPTIQPPALTMIYPVTLPVKLSLPNFPCPASFAASQPPASSAPSQPAASSAAPCTDLLRDIWAGKVGGRLWSKIGPYKIFTWDLERLKPAEKLESEVINAYLTCIASRYKGNVFVIDTFQMTNLWNGKATEMKKIDLKVYDLLVGSVNEGGFMDQKGFEDTTWKCLLGGDLNFSCDDTNIAQMREELGLCLLTESEPLGNLCLACGDHYPDTPDLVDTWGTGLICLPLVCLPDQVYRAVAESQPGGLLPERGVLSGGSPAHGEQAHTYPGSSESSSPSVKAKEDDEGATTKSGSDSPESVVSEGEDNTSCSSLEGLCMIKVEVINRLYDLDILKLPDVDKETDPFGRGQDVLETGKGELEMAAVETEVDVGVVLPPFEPFSPSIPSSRGEVQTKVRIARLRMEAQERAQARQAELDLRLEVRRLEFQADKEVKLRKLEIEVAKAASVPTVQRSPLSAMEAVVRTAGPTAIWDIPNIWRIVHWPVVVELVPGNEKLLHRG
ncbi:hypothetical protein QQF64_023819 [Cirrhinus molitorella]|uniref:Integrase catalytic domain-containing protein n=1 Tax=Cirrhinus molitorella TaxID=172907 RepID=A0ABR3NKC8_9TELE